ncbi:putative MFS family arabinose efflux permease [Psychromicrobium silvestre]|uniref:Putative MFS family arabinose efflux permease n=1 Tax=Psychromicrobium silvestre TaxID=1645614 RepID=A0A7Y9LU62_9MICC|nr:putative MFS family arabinose efflux permease [Psychromicrobium silvestre]
MPEAWAGHLRGSKSYRRILIALACAGVATFAQLYSVQGVLPAMSADLHVSAADAALTVSAATIGLALAVIPWSAVADRIGRLRAMSIAVIAAVALGLLVPLMPNLPSLLSLRFLEGAALGGIPALALAYLSEEVHKLHAGIAAGTYIAGTTVGGLLGRVIAGPIGDLAGWRIGILTVSLLASVAAVWFILLAPGQRGFSPVRKNDGGPGLVARLAINLRNPALLALYAQGFLLMGGFVAIYNYLGFRLEAPPFVLPATITSLLFLAYLAGTVTSRVAGGLSTKLGRRRVLAGSTAVMILGVVLTMVPWLPVVLLGLLVLTGGYFAAHAMASSWTTVRASIGPAQAASLYNLFFYTGSSLIGWLGGFVFQALGWIGLALMVMALALLAMLTAWAALRSPGEAPLR